MNIIKIGIIFLAFFIHSVCESFAQRPNIAIAYIIPPWNKRIINYNQADVFLQTTNKKFTDIKDVNLLFNLITETSNFHLIDTLIFESDLDFRMGVKFYYNNDIVSSFLWSRSKGGVVYFNGKYYSYNDLVKSIFEKYNLIF